MSATYVLHKDDTTKEFESREEFDEMVQLLEDQDVDFETETAEDAADAIESDANVEVVDDTDKMKEGYEKASEQAVEESMPETGLPERDLQEDPIVWLQRGSDEFVVDIKGTSVVTKKGWRVLQYKYDITTTSEIVVGPEETDFKYCRVKATATMPDGTTAEAHGSGHTDRGDDHFLLAEMADTRAKSRALSDITGVGAVAQEEMDGVETE